MDRGSLVREQLDGGEKLIRRLVSDGLGVTGAAWAQLDGDADPYLYLVVPDVEARGSRAAYRRVSAAQIALEAEGLHWLERLDRFGTKLLSARDPFARGLARYYADAPPSPHPVWTGSRPFGGVYVDGAYVYPAALFRPAPRPEPAAPPAAT